MTLAGRIRAAESAPSASRRERGSFAGISRGGIREKQRAENSNHADRAARALVVRDRAVDGEPDASSSWSSGARGAELIRPSLDGSGGLIAIFATLSRVLDLGRRDLRLLATRTLDFLVVHPVDEQEQAAAASGVCAQYTCSLMRRCSHRRGIYVRLISVGESNDSDGIFAGPFKRGPSAGRITCVNPCRRPSLNTIASITVVAQMTGPFG